MTTPRRTPPTEKQRQNTAIEVQGTQSRHGGTHSPRPTSDGHRSVQYAQWGVEVIEHGDDPDTERPAVGLVFWVGAATPSNAVDYDLWFPATI